MNKIDEMLASFAQEDLERTVSEEENQNKEDNKEYALEIVNSRAFQSKLREVLVDLLDFSAKKMYEVTGKDLGIDHEEYLGKAYPKSQEFNYEPDQDYKSETAKDKEFFEGFDKSIEPLINLRKFKDKLDKGFIPNSAKNKDKLKELMDKLDRENEEFERLKGIVNKKEDTSLTPIIPAINDPSKKAYILNNFIKAANIVSYDRMADAIFSYGRNNLTWDINSFLVKELSDFKFDNLGDAISFIKKISKEDLKKHLAKSIYTMANQIAKTIIFTGGGEFYTKFRLDFMNLALNKIHTMLVSLFR